MISAFPAGLMGLVPAHLLSWSEPSVTPVEAAEKRRATEGTHAEDIVLSMKHAVMAGGGLGLGFTQIIKEGFPGSFKKHTGGNK